MMTLKQLGIDERQRYPEASKALEQNFYMDDALCGSYDVMSAKKLQRQLIDLLKTGGFNLRKFSSNEKSLLEDVAPSSPNTYDFKHQESTKALGLTWIAKDDNFTFQCKMTAPTTTKPTKRVLLAEISKVFDPCGFISPAMVQLKQLFQSVWQENLIWDDVIPDDVYSNG
ncbi:unnamed protein product [Parnassius mnemosyne]|uniref:Uncharacterized protein n=1 Tax=Parnassius mnemosyne TaxID=213953 RepID=A0AAV1LQN5_9NEOP